MGQGIKILLDLEKIIQHSSFYERYDWLEICYQKPFFGPVNCSKRVDFQTFSEQIYENRTSLNKNTEIGPKSDLKAKFRTKIGWKIDKNSKVVRNLIKSKNRTKTAALHDSIHLIRIFLKGYKAKFGKYNLFRSKISCYDENNI